MGASKGVIRWDAWTLQGTAGTLESQMLSPVQWRDKLPFYTVIQPDGTVVIDHDSVAATEAQNVAAVSLGIDHWVFLDYPEAPVDVFLGGFDKGLSRYLVSSNIGLVKFCMMVGGHFLSVSGTFQASDWSANVTRYVTLMLNSQYKKVLTNRPLLYFFYVDSGFISAMGGTSSAAAAITTLRNACTGAGLGNPYIVQMNGETDIGLDAFSYYAFFQPSGTLTEVPYSTLANDAASTWASWAAGSVPFIPLAMDGWDYRPRNSVLNPYGTEAGPAMFTTRGTLTQRLAHFQAAVDFVAANPTKCPADTVLVYAWNEFSEGGLLCPKLADLVLSRPKTPRSRFGAELF